MTQCEVQGDWFVVQVNDLWDWSGYLSAVAAGTFPAEGIFDLPVQAFSSALSLFGSADSEYSTFIFSFRDRCETVFEYPGWPIHEAARAFAVGMEEWETSVSVASALVEPSTLTIAGC